MKSKASYFYRPDRLFGAICYNHGFEGWGGHFAQEQNKMFCEFTNAKQVGIVLQYKQTSLQLWIED